MKVRKTNEITLKIKYTCDEISINRILEYIKNYNNVLRFVYNRLYEAPKQSLSTKDAMAEINSMNNVFVDTYFKSGALYEAKALIKKNKEDKVIFGGKKLFIDRCKGKVDKEEFELRKLHPLQIVGASHNKGNCKFQIIDLNNILFKPTKDEHFILNIDNIGKNYQIYLNSLIDAQNKCKLPLTYKLDTEYVYITFDLDKLNPPKPTYPISNRFFAVDMNPNYIGYSVLDWKDSDNFEIIKTGVISNKPLNDYENSLSVASTDPEHLYITNKRKYEVTHIAKDLVKLAKHFRCELFVIEELTIKSKDNDSGAKYNRWVNNQWCRSHLVNILNKECLQNSMYLLAIKPEYSSFVGNLAYRYLQLPDMVLSSIEISRRGYEFYHQYLLEDKTPEKNIIFNNSSKVHKSIEKSLEEFGFAESWKDIRDLYYKLKKKMGCNYRFPLEKSLEIHSQSLLSRNYNKKYLSVYTFK